MTEMIWHHYVYFFGDSIWQDSSNPASSIWKNEASIRPLLFNHYLFLNYYYQKHVFYHMKNLQTMRPGDSII